MTPADPPPTIAYGVVVAFDYTTRHPLLDLNRRLQDEVLALLGRLAADGYGNTAGVVDIAVREVTQGTGKLTSGQWGGNKV